MAYCGDFAWSVLRLAMSVYLFADDGFTFMIYFLAAILSLSVVHIGLCLCPGRWPGNRSKWSGIWLLSRDFRMPALPPVRARRALLSPPPVYFTVCSTEKNQIRFVC